MVYGALRAEVAEGSFYSAEVSSNLTLHLTCDLWGLVIYECCVCTIKEQAMVHSSELISDWKTGNGCVASLPEDLSNPSVSGYCCVSEIVARVSNILFGGHTRQPWEGEVVAEGIGSRWDAELTDFADGVRTLGDRDYITIG